MRRWLLAAAGGGAALLWLASDTDGLSGRVAAAEEADKAAGSGNATSAPEGPHHDYAHVNRALDPDFFDAEQYKLNEEGQVAHPLHCAPLSSLPVAQPSPA